MTRETKKFPFTVEDITKAMGGYKDRDILFMENRLGCGRDSRHNYFYVMIGHTEFSDEGKNLYNYTFAEAVADHCKRLEPQLAEQGIHIHWTEKQFVSGYDTCWHTDLKDKLLVPEQVVEITPCKEFAVLQKWVKKYAGHNLGMFDLFSAEICRKHDNVSESGHCYLATNAWLCIENMKKIKAAYKQGNIVKVEMQSNDSYEEGYDPNRSGYEQYGERYTTMVLTFATPTGRNERKLCVGRYC